MRGEQGWDRGGIRAAGAAPEEGAGCHHRKGQSSTAAQVLQQVGKPRAEQQLFVHQEQQSKGTEHRKGHQELEGS